MLYAISYIKIIRILYEKWLFIWNSSITACFIFYLAILPESGFQILQIPELDYLRVNSTFFNFPNKGSGAE